MLIDSGIYVISSGAPVIENEVRNSLLINETNHWNPYALNKALRGVRRIHYILPLFLKSLWLPRSESLVNAKYVIVFDGAFASLFLTNLTKISQATIIYYFWNPILHDSQLTRVINVADRVVTFDQRDSNKYGLEYAPAFCAALSRESERRAKSEGGKKFDLFFVGQAKGRAEQVGNLIKRFEGVGLRVFVHVQGTRDEARAYSFVKVNPISYLQYEVCMRASRAVLDLTAPNQRGMTVRGYQALGAGVKVITDNESLMSTIDGMERDNLMFLEEFLEVSQAAREDFLNSPFSGDSESFRRKYGFDEWIRKLVVRQ